jgi:hypothetical protein
LEKLPVSTELRISSIPLSFVFVLVYAHANVGVFTRTPFYLSLLVDSTSCFNFNFLDRWMDGWMDGWSFISADGWSTWGCLAVFPRLKGRTSSFLSFLSDY